MASDRLGHDTPSRSAGRDPDRDSDATEHDPQSATTPTQSAWWTAPAGRPVAIPAFGRSWFGRSWLEALQDLLTPKPVLVPVKIKARGPRRRA